MKRPEIVKEKYELKKKQEYQFKKRTEEKLPYLGYSDIEDLVTKVSAPPRAVRMPKTVN